MGLEELRSSRRRMAAALAVLGNALPILVVTFFDLDSHPTAFFVGAAGACVVPLIVTLVPRRHRVIVLVAALSGIPFLTLLQAYTGGPASGYAVLMLMAMIYFGIYASGREVGAALVTFVVCSYGPMLVVGPPAYPVSWAHATALVLVGLAVTGSLRTLTTEMRALTERLRRMAVIDDLTGLYNRRGWSEAAERTLARAARSGTPVGLVVLDLDGLKRVNDRLGHEEGDRLLCETADRMRAAFRETDVLARLGGDEFVVLLSDSSPDETVLAEECLRGATPARGAYSAGIASWNGREEPDELLRRADNGLYEAKASGGGVVAPASSPVELPATVGS